MERKFKKGDVVRLTSDTENNVSMTVRGYAVEIASNDPTVAPFLSQFKEQLQGMVTCDWRDKNDTPQKYDYHENELVKCNVNKA